MNAEVKVEVGRFDFFNVGKEYSKGKEDEVKEIVLSAEWEETTKGKDYPMGQGMCVQEAIKELKIPKVSHVSLYNSFCGLGFYGIRGTYKNNVVDIFILDQGSIASPIAAHVKDRKI